MSDSSQALRFWVWGKLHGFPWGRHATSELEALVGPVDVDTDHSWGLAGQVGVDIDFKDNWFFNVDVKYIDIDTTATLQTIPLGRLRVNVDVDPFVFGAGLGYRF